MLTGIYVFASTTLTFQTSETVVLTSINQNTITASGNPLHANVMPGVYKVETNATINVTFANKTDGSFFQCPSPECPSLKDSPPNPPPLQAQELHLYTDQTQLNTFFGHDAARDEGFPTAAVATAAAAV